MTSLTFLQQTTAMCLPVSQRKAGRKEGNECVFLKMYSRGLRERHTANHHSHIMGVVHKYKLRTF